MSNRSKASSLPRKGRTLMGGSSIALVSGLRDTTKAVVIVKGKHRGSTKLASSLPGSWSDTYHKPSNAVDYSLAAWARINTVRIRFNPNKVQANKQTLRVWDAVKRKFVARRIQIGAPGSKYQAPAPELLMRGEPCLFDDCTGKPSLRNQQYHPVTGSLPAWTPSPIVKPEREAINAAVQAWKAAQLLAYYDALIAWRT